MILRKAFYWWLFPSAVILPVWLLIGWAVFGSGGWTFLGLLILCPILFVALLAVGGIVMARKTVRDQRAVSWWDVGLIAAWQAAIVAFGCFIPGVMSWLAVLGVVLALAAFWVALWQLVTEARMRVQQTFEAYERAAQPRQVHRPEALFDEGSEVIVIEERHDER